MTKLIDAINIAKNLASKNSTDMTEKMVEYSRDSESLYCLTYYGAMEIKGLEYNFDSGVYFGEQIAGMAKLLGEEPGEWIEGGCKIGNVKVNLNQVQDRTIKEKIPTFDFTKEFKNVELKSLKHALDSCKNFVKEGNAVSKILFENGVVVAFEGTKILRTSVIECETGQESEDPMMQALEGLTFELTPNHLKPLQVMFNASDSEEVTIRLSEQLTQFESDTFIVTLFCDKYGDRTTVNQVASMFESTDYTLSELSPTEIRESVENLLALDLSKNKVANFLSDTPKVTSLDSKVEITLSKETKQPFQVITKYLENGLGVFEGDFRLKVYPTYIILEDDLNTSVLLMQIVKR